MKEFIILKSSIKERISELLEKINDIRDRKASFEKEQELIENVYNKESENFNSKRRREIVKLYPSMRPLFELFDRMKKYKQMIDNEELSLIDYDEMINDLKLIKVSIFELDTFIKKYDYCKNLIPTVSNPFFNDVSVIESLDKALDYIKEFINHKFSSFSIGLNEVLRKEFENRYFGLEEEVSKIDSLFAEIERLKRIDIFDEEGNIVKFFEDKEELSEFYKWMKDNIDISLQLKLIPLITKEGILQLNKDKDIEEVSLNREKVLEEFQDNLTDIDILDNLDLSSYTEEEKEKIIVGLEIYKELRQTIKERTALLYRTDIEEKEIVYKYNDMYRWDIVFHDLENNVIPFINEDKENTLKTIELITEMRKQELIEIEKRSSILNELFDEIDEYESLLQFGEKYDTSQYDYIIDNGIGVDQEEYPKDIPIEQIRMSYYLRHKLKSELDELYDKKEMIEKLILERAIMTSENDGINLDELNSRFKSVYDEVNHLVEEFKSVLKDRFDKKDIEEEQINPTNNLVFCIFDISEAIGEEYRKDFENSYNYLAHRPAFAVSKLLHELWKTSSSRKRISYKIPNVEMKRVRHDSSRLGVAKFDVSESIMKILKEKYNLSDDANVYVMFNAITPGANHKPYSELHRAINKNIETITMLGEMFNDKNVDFEKLFQIIDKGIAVRDQLIKGEVISHE